VVPSDEGEQTEYPEAVEIVKARKRVRFAPIHDSRSEGSTCGDMTRARSSRH